MDETTDSCGRSVLNILFSYHNKTKLVNTIFLEVVNYITISQSFINTVRPPYSHLLYSHTSL